jgi:hypothetical protein
MPLRDHAQQQRRDDLAVAPGKVAPAIGGAAVAHIKSPPSADQVACSDRAITGFWVIDPACESRRRDCRVEHEDDGDDGCCQNKMFFVH